MKRNHNYINGMDPSKNLQGLGDEHFRAFYAKNLHKIKYKKFNSSLISKEKNILSYDILFDSCENPEDQYVFNSPATIIMKGKSLTEIEETTCRFEEYDKTGEWFIQ